MTSKGRIEYLIKNVGILTLSDFASKVMTFLMVPLYTSVLTTAEYGVYDLIMSTLAMLFPILTLNINDAVMRFAMDRSKDVREVATIGIRYISWSIVPVGAFLLVSSRLGLLETIQGFELWIFLYSIFYVLHQFLVQFAKGLEHVADMGIAGVLGTVTVITANILCLLVFRMRLQGFFLATVLAQAIPSVYLFLRLRVWKYMKGQLTDKPLRREMLAYCVPLIFSAVGWRINNVADKYAVTLMVSAAANGLLSVAYKIPTILNTFQQIFMQAWQITVLKEYGGEKADTFYGGMFTVFNMLLTGICAALIILSRPLARILYANDFYAAWQYVPFLLISSLLNADASFFGPILSATKDSKSMARSVVYGSVINVILNIVLVYFAGVHGAAVATAVSSLVIYLVRRSAVRGEITVRQDWKTYTGWGMLCILAVLEINRAGYAAEIAVFVLGMLLYKEQLAAMLQKMKTGLGRLVHK